MDRLERDKAIADLLKHLGTLSAASIAFLATFATKTDALPKADLDKAVVALALALLLSLFAYAHSLWRFFGRTDIHNFDVVIWTLLATLTAVCFGAGYGFIAYGVIGH